MTMILGPLLGFEGETEAGKLRYSVCFLAKKLFNGENAHLLVDFGGASPLKIKLKHLSEWTTYSGQLWRASFQLDAPIQGRAVSYRIDHGGGTFLADPRKATQWTYHQPGQNEEPHIAYTSCNGYSDNSLTRKQKQGSHALWDKMAEEHQDNPYSLLLMGGDQLYADGIWDLKPFEDWSKLNKEKMVKRQFSSAMRRRANRFYEMTYIKQWGKPEVATMLATVPNLMMWDDHDVFDGWGSHPDWLQESSVYQGLYQVASRYFEMFQLHTKENAALLSPDNRDNPHYSWACKWGQRHIVALDNRSQRRLNRIMDEDHWKDIEKWLKGLPNSAQQLMVLSGVPVVYRSFAAVEEIMDTTPWREELEDDLHDHWSSKLHQDERLRLVMGLMQTARRLNSQGATCCTLILSGDVHVGAHGEIEDPRSLQRIHQIISSGMVHPPPGWFAWHGALISSNDDPVTVTDGGETAVMRMLDYQDGDRYLRTRNYCALTTQNNGQVAVRWVCENNKNPSLPPLS